ncbi:hypothetical protein NDU88_010650 [Pleurodeles waltl]|uniref:Uncharacterized protein n=1 Tax=Pleurodeles waltl TaxID=8319 RepID=A0AAV7Q2K0_PLEWA|nr:hypothetical protein NDU88_010650 [Pleurodeles waltl]
MTRKHLNPRELGPLGSPKCSNQLEVSSDLRWGYIAESQLRLIMAQYMDDEQYGEYDADHYDQHMEECLVEALDFHVQDSVNNALVKAKRPFAQPIFNYGGRRFGAGLGNSTLVEVNITEPSRSSNDLTDQIVNTVLNDHEYGAFQNHATPSVQTSQHSADSDTLASDASPIPDKPNG